MTGHDAAATGRSSVANAVGRCQGALPVFDSAIRKRPLAVQNESSLPAFVTCAFLSDQANATIHDFGVYAISNDGSDADLTCTAVLVYQTGDPVYATRSVTLPGAGAQASIYWAAQDFGIATISPFDPIMISCALPSGAGLNDTYLNFDDGA